LNLGKLDTTKHRNEVATTRKYMKDGKKRFVGTRGLKSTQWLRCIYSLMLFISDHFIAKWMESISDLFPINSFPKTGQGVSSKILFEDPLHAEVSASKQTFAAKRCWAFVSYTATHAFPVSSL